MMQLRKKKKRKEENIKLTRRESTFGVILGIGGQMVISGKQQQLHSYNSSKCINDHRWNNEGEVLDETSCRDVAPRRLTTPTTARQPSRERTKQRKISRLVEKKKKFKSFFLSYKAHCAVRVGGTKLDCFNKSAPTLPLSPRKEKKKLSFHEYSTSNIETTQVSAWIFKKKKA